MTTQLNNNTTNSNTAHNVNFVFVFLLKDSHSPFETARSESSPNSATRQFLLFLIYSGTD